MLDKLKTLNLERMDLEECIELHAYATNVEVTFKRFEVPVPTYIVDGLDSLARDIRSRREDALKARLKEIKARKAALRTREEQRAELDNEEQRLTQLLGQ